MIREAIILAGGLGTRLKPAVSDVPKSMAPVNGRPFLEYLLDWLIVEGISRVILSVGYKADIIRDHFGDRYQSVEMAYAMEEEPLGTGGGIRNAFRHAKGEEAFVLNGDSLFEVGLPEMFEFHREGEGLITIALRYVADAGRYGMVRTDHLHRIIGFSEKQQDAGPGFINGGIYILNRAFITGERFGDRFSIEKDCFETYYRDVVMLGFPSDGYFLDIGVPDDYNKAHDEFKRLKR